MKKDYSKMTKAELVEECKRKDSEWMGLYEINKKQKETINNLNWDKCVAESKAESTQYQLDGANEKYNNLKSDVEVQKRDAQIEVYDKVLNKLTKRRH